LQVGDEGNNYTQNSDEAIAWNSEKEFEDILYTVWNKPASDIWPVANFTVRNVDLTTSRSRKKVPWIDPIHICIEYLRFPILPSSHLAILFTRISSDKHVVTLATSKHFGLVELDLRVPEGVAIVGREGKASSSDIPTIHGPSFSG
jgi:hypothetical protein